MRVALPFGSGLDRYTGVMQVRPGSMADIRNMRPRGDKLVVRRGLSVQSTLPAQGSHACTAVCHIQQVRSYGEALVVGYHDGDRSVHVYRTDPEGQSVTHIGRWFTVGAGLPVPPRITGADSYRTAFLAHDEEIDSRRAATKVYQAVAGTLADLQADLRGSGNEAVKFRGVTTWSAYLVGWGFGHAGEVRPELVRVSKPANPTSFDPEHYFIAGDRGSPVTTCQVLGSGLLVLKPTSTYQIVGSSHLNFGILPRYRLAGCLATRLAVSVEGSVYGWGFEGPWVMTPDGAEDLETPLDLEGPAPADLPEMGDLLQGFAVYIPSERVVEWHFGERVYALHLEGGLRWSYRHRSGCSAGSGGLVGVSLSDGRTSVPSGYPTVEGVVGQGDHAILTWKNNSQAGDEILEIWVTPTLDQALVAPIGSPGSTPVDDTITRFEPSWTQQFPSIEVTSAATQTARINDLVLGRSYEVAIRYRRGGKYAVGYQGTPSEWPTTARRSFSVRPPSVSDLAAAFKWDDAKFWMQITWTEPENQEGATYRVFRDGARVGTVRGGTFIDRPANAEREYRYHVVTVSELGIFSPDSDDAVVWAGPHEPTNVTLTPVDYGEDPTDPADLCGAGNREYTLTWDRQIPGFSFPASYHSQWDNGLGGGYTDVPARLASAARAVVCARSGSPRVRVRNYVLGGDRRYYSRWVDA